MARRGERAGRERCRSRHDRQRHVSWTPKNRRRRAIIVTARPLTDTLRAITTPSSRPDAEHRLVRVERADGDRAILEAAAALDADERRVAVLTKRVARDRRSRAACARASRRATPTDRASGSDASPCTSTSTMKVRTFAESTEVTPSGEICATRPSKKSVGIGVEADADGLPDLQLVDVGLVDARTHPHRVRIDDVDDRHAGADFLAFLHLRHVVALPDRLHDRHAANRRMDGHAFGVAGRLPLRVGGAVAADLEDADVGFGGAALQLVGGLELLQRRLRLLERQRVLLGVDLRQQLVLAHFELRAADRALGERHLAVVVRPRGALLRFALRDLLLEILQLGAAIERVLDLILAIELDNQIARADGDCRARTSLVMTSEFEFGPDSRGAAIVVDCTASTVPLNRTVRTKSRRATLNVASHDSAAGC